MYIVQANTVSTTASPIVDKAKNLATGIVAMAFSIGTAVMESGFKIKSNADAKTQETVTAEKSAQPAQRSHQSRHQEDRSDFGQKLKDAIDAKNV